MQRWLPVVIVLAALAACGDDGANVDAAPTDWIAGPVMPAPRLEPGVAAVGGRLAVVGGFDTPSGITMRADALVPETGVWTALPDAPVAWTHLGLAGKGGVLFLLGGLEGVSFVPHGEAWVLDATAPAWQPLPSMPAGRERGAAGIAVGPVSIYVVGGADQTAALATVLAYDVAAMTWSELPALPAPRSHPAVFVLADGTLIVTGGLATLDASSPLAETVRLRPGAPAWETGLAPLPTPRGGCATGTIGTLLICAGGEAGMSALDVVEAYDVASDSWRTLEPMPERRAGTQGAVVGSRFFVPGGAHQLTFTPVDTIAIYAPR